MVQKESKKISGRARATFPLLY